MRSQAELILIVENDPEITDIIARQTLQPLGYRVTLANTAAVAIQKAVQSNPTVVITNLELPDLSGKDLLVALSAQAIDAPVIVISTRQGKGDILQAFRLGAADFLPWPLREAEIVSAVERLLKQVRSRREKEHLAHQLRLTNQELQQRVRELTTIFAVGKAVTSLTDSRALQEKIVEGAIYITTADKGWFLLRSDHSKGFILGASRNLPAEVTRRQGQVWDDGISSLVGLSGEPLAIHGEPLKRFKVARLGQAALVMPVKIQKEVVGLITVVRHEARQFTRSEQTLLEAVADYASISLVNARLFLTLEQRARRLQSSAEASEANRQKSIQAWRSHKASLKEPLHNSLQTINTLLAGEGEHLNATQKGLLKYVLHELTQIEKITAAHLLPEERGENP